MSIEKKKYNKLVNHIYTKYSLRYELKYSMKMIGIILAFGLATMVGYSFYLLKSQEVMMMATIQHVLKVNLMILIAMISLIVISLLLDVIIRKIRFDEKRKKEEFENYLQEEFERMHASGKISSYEIGRFYLFDTLLDFDKDYTELGITLDDVPKKQKQVKGNKKKNSTVKKTNTSEKVKKKKKESNSDNIPKQEPKKKKQTENKKKNNKKEVIDHRARRLSHY